MDTDVLHNEPGANVNCVYGCTDPLTCPYPHRECEHCSKVRTARYPKPEPLPYDPKGKRSLSPQDEYYNSLSDVDKIDAWLAGGGDGGE